MSARCSDKLNVSVNKCKAEPFDIFYTYKKNTINQFRLIFVKYLLPLLTIFYFSSSSAQTDSTINKTTNLQTDTSLSKTPTAKPDTAKPKWYSYPSPKVAALCSAILPGSGQIYNKKYWKLPLVYGGLGTFGYFILKNNALFKTYKDAYIMRFDTSAAAVTKYTLPEQSQDNLNVLTEQYRKRRDLLIILSSVFYALQILDATVDAHLYKFDVSDDLSLNIKPYCYSTNFALHNKLKPAFAAGLSLSFNFK